MGRLFPQPWDFPLVTGFSKISKIETSFILTASFLYTVPKDFVTSVLKFSVMKKMYNQVEIEIIKGDIAAQPGIDAVVNAANAELAMGGGVAGAIHRGAGPELYEECKPYAPINPGEAVITKAYNLPNKYVIHCLGPVYGRDTPEENLLANCYKNALKRAEEKKCESIAFPAISTGAFGYPVKEATEITFKTILSEIPGLKHLQKIKFVLFSEGDLKIYEAVFKDLS